MFILHSRYQRPREGRDLPEVTQELETEPGLDSGFKFSV